MTTWNKFVFICVLCLLLASCIHRSYHLREGIVVDGVYDSEYPVLPLSGYYEDITKSVQLVSILSYYEMSGFAPSARITNTDIRKNRFQGKVQEKHYFQKPANGTATVISFQNNHVVLLTCAHIFNFPDTLIAYFKDEKGNDTGYIQSFAVKTKEQRNIIDIPQARDFEILALDESADIAIIGKQLRKPLERPLAVFNYPAGKANELGWGTLVHLFGYPRGKKMVSTSLVSNPDRDRTHSFLLNATFPRGISGAIVLALRDGAPHFELVGMVNAVSAESRYVLTPNQHKNIDELDAMNSYKGDIFVQNQENMFYGVTFAVSVEAIKKVLAGNRQALMQKGINHEQIFSGKGIEFIFP